MPKCKAHTQKGGRCKNNANVGGTCGVHKSRKSQNRKPRKSRSRSKSGGQGLFPRGQGFFQRQKEKYQGKRRVSSHAREEQALRKLDVDLNVIRNQMQNIVNNMIRDCDESQSIQDVCGYNFSQLALGALKFNRRPPLQNLPPLQNPKRGRSTAY